MIDSNESNERAEGPESATSPERAGGLESTEPKERADERESAALRERADLPESAEQPEQPIHKAGYPQINFASHSLWEAQQAGWPDHLPHEAWTEMIRLYNADKPPKGRSDEHPAFREDYAPNYMATPLDPKPEPASKPGTKTRR